MTGIEPAWPTCGATLVCRSPIGRIPNRNDPLRHELAAGHRRSGRCVRVLLRGAAGAVAGLRPGAGPPHRRVYHDAHDRPDGHAHHGRGRRPVVASTGRLGINTQTVPHRSDRSRIRSISNLVIYRPTGRLCQPLWQIFYTFTRSARFLAMSLRDVVELTPNE